MEQDIFKIVVTGPESSGKTTLANELAAALNCPCVPEFARPYVTHLGRPYGHNDLKSIALGQQLWEYWFENQSRPDNSPLICDTDWTVIHVWELFKYGTTTITSPLPDPAPLYLLCSPDFDWKPDPLREHPHERNTLFDLYVALLRESGANYHILSGDLENRLQKALHLIREYS